MDHQFCPGSKFMRQPKPEFMNCPYCHDEVEIWSDEIKAVCPKCGQTLMREGNMSCLEWCSFAEDCVGTTIFQDYVQKRTVGVKSKLLDAIDGLYGATDTRNRQARDVLRITEQLMATEGADPKIAIPSAILHQADPETVRAQLLRLGFTMADIEDTVRIVQSLQSDDIIESANFGVVHDACRLAGIADRDESSTDQARLLTNAGKEQLALATARAPQ